MEIILADLHLSHYNWYGFLSSFIEYIGMVIHVPRHIFRSDWHHET